MAAIAAPLEMLIKNLPAMALAVVIAVQYLVQVIGILVTTWISSLKGLELVNKYLMVEGTVTAKRDHLIVILIRLLRRGRFLWKRSGFSKYIVRLGNYLNVNFEPRTLAGIRIVGSFFSCFSRKLGAILQESVLSSYLKFKVSTAAGKIETCRIRLLEVRASAFGHDMITCNLS